jgi:hypothetical protein
MKQVLSISLAALSIFASVAKANETNPQSPAAQAVLSRDMRPVDGPLTQVVFQEGRFGGTDVVLKTSTLRGYSSEKIIALSLDCDFEVSAINCEKDARPVDGAFVQIKAIMSKGGIYSVEMKNQFYDRMNGKEVTKTEVVATGLERTL